VQLESPFADVDHGEQQLAASHAIGIHVHVDAGAAS
jgi:hypothetical protein